MIDEIVEVSLVEYRASREDFFDRTLRGEQFLVKGENFEMLVGNGRVTLKDEEAFTRALEEAKEAARGVNVKALRIELSLEL